MIGRWESISSAPLSVAGVIGQTESLADRGLAWPDLEQWQRVLLLQDYNTRIVVFGAAMLGCAAGLVGCFTLLRKRALMGDAISHATLPGIAIAFVIASRLGWNERSLPILLLGATVSGLAGVAVILWLRRWTRLKEDTALGIVLSVFFGGGVALMGVVQQMKTGRAAGLESFILGRTASMNLADARLIAAASLVCVVVCLLLYKEFKLLCFDESFAGSRGFPVLALDIGLMFTVVVISIVGLQAVGLILMVALLIIPAAAARFWTENLWVMVVIAAVLGGAGGMLGAAVSALFPKLPSGAMIVLTCSTFFLVSMVFGPARGVTARVLRRRRLNRSIQRQHLLRAVFELLEGDAADDVSIGQLLPERSWSRTSLNRAIERARREELVTRLGDRVGLTRKGLVEATRLTREHRLWELYLITHAEIAPSRVDREADRIEHVLEPDVVAELEAMLNRESSAIPESPHRLTAAASIGDAAVAVSPDAGGGS